MGCQFIHSLSNEDENRFDRQILNAREQGKLSAPHCTYMHALNLARDWEKDNEEQDLSKKRGHKNHTESRKRKRDEADLESRVTRIAAAYLHENSSMTAKRGVFMSKYVCKHCKGTGHFESKCNKASAEERKKYLEDYLKTKKSNKMVKPK